MQYLPRVKFNASLNSSGDIIPGTAVNGYETSTISETCYCLIENPTTFVWELCKYDPSLPSGSRKTTIYSNGLNTTPLIAPQSGLIVAFVANPNAYVLNSQPGEAPTVASAYSTAIGAGASTEVNSNYSMNIGGIVRDSSHESVVVGRNAQVQGKGTTALGYQAYALETYNNNIGDTVSVAGSTAIGSYSRTTAGGEVSLGDCRIPHMSGVPIMTNDPSAGGTFFFRAVSGYGSGFTLVDILNNTGAFLPGDGGGGGNDFGNWVLHVTGIIVARDGGAANDKIVKVEWVSGGALSQTVMTNGANNISLGLALDTNGMSLKATVAAVPGLKLSGYLHLTKITW